MKLTIHLFLILFYGSISGQNLVPNPSFEEYEKLECNLNTPINPPFVNPKTWFQSILKDWILPTKIPAQVYSTLLSRDCLANPTYLFNKGYPKDGFNMVELELLGLYLLHLNTRAYVEVNLKEKLIAQEFYLVGGYYSLANNYGSYAANNLGMLFTQEQIGSDTTLMLNYIPQVNENDINTDPLVWKPFGGCLIANGDEQYLTIGNFFDNNHTKAIQVLSGDTRGSDFASYFIDSVYVEKIKPLFIPNVITPNGDSSNEKFVITGLIPGQWTVSFYNRWGKRVFYDNKYKNEWNGGSLSNGVYFYFVQNNICPNLQYNGSLTIIR